MKYLVMECHKGYAVVLDEQGAFSKVVNKGYEVGQSVDRVIDFTEVDQKRNKVIRKTISKVAVAAACFCVVVGMSLQNYVISYGQVRIEAGTDVLLTVNRKQQVIGVEWLNEEGEQLLEGIAYRHRAVDEVIEELLHKSKEMGYLSADSDLEVKLYTRQGQWCEETCEIVQDIITETSDLDINVTVLPTEEAPKGNGKGQGNGNGKGQGNGNDSGQENGPGQGNGPSQENNPGKGNGPSQENRPGQGNGNGSGQENGLGHGYSPGVGTGQEQENGQGGETDKGPNGEIEQEPDEVGGENNEEDLPPRDKTESGDGDLGGRKNRGEDKNHGQKNRRER